MRVNILELRQSRALSTLSSYSLIAVAFTAITTLSHRSFAAAVESEASLISTQDCGFERLQVRTHETEIEKLDRKPIRFSLGGKPDYELMRKLQSMRIGRIQHQMNQLKEKSHKLQLCLAKEADRVRRTLELEDLKRQSEEQRREYAARAEQLRYSAQTAAVAQPNSKPATVKLRAPASVSAESEVFVVPDPSSLPSGQTWVPTTQ